MADVNKLREVLEEACADAHAAIEHKQKIKSDLREAEAWLTEALRRETEARFALRAATGDRQDG